MNDKAVCRTALDTPGLLNIGEYMVIASPAIIFFFKLRVSSIKLNKHIGSLNDMSMNTNSHV